MKTENGAARRIIREPRCEELTGLSRWARHRMEKCGEFPRRIKLGRKAVGWLEESVLSWQDAQARGEQWQAPAPDVRTSSPDA